MDEMKDKMKGFMKKFNTSSSSHSSSGKFKGQGRVLGSSSSSIPSGPVNSNPNRPATHINDPKPVPPPRPAPSTPNVLPKKPVTSEQPAKSTNGFDPFDSLITTGKRNKNGYDLKVFECPVCSRAFGSEEEVSDHVESCLSNNESQSRTDEIHEQLETQSELDTCVGTYVSGKPSDGSIEIVLKLLKNIIKEPENVKFRKIRLGNPKIKEAIADVTGGLDLLECVGFELKEENGEVWAVMEVASGEKIKLIKQAVNLLEPPKSETVSPTTVQAKVVQPVEVKKVERQARVFFSVSESVAAKIELPDSFYNLSVEEVKKEAELRRKKLAESQLLVPKSYKEKQAKAARKRHEKSVIRIQFPDGVVLQAFFNPMEPTSALYEDLDSSMVNAVIKVRIIKLWNRPSFKIPNGIHSTEMILMDEQGDKIQATVMNTYLRKLDKFFVEKQCLLIGKPVIGDNDQKNPLLEHRHKLFFNFETVISKCDDFVGSLHGFSFVSFDLLHNNVVPNASTVDIIGYIYTFFPIEDHITKTGKVSKKMNLQIRDLESRSLFVTLWESHAYKMESFLQTKQDGVTAVMILQFGKYYFSGGRAYVHSAFQGSSLYFNNDIPEILDFKNSLLHTESNDSTSTRQLVPSDYVTNTQDEFLNLSAFNSVADVNTIAEVKSVIVMGTIISFPPGAEWYYPACKNCNKKVTIANVDEKDVVLCPTDACNKKAVLWVPRFKIPLRVQDSTGVLSLTLFEKEAKKLFSKTAKDLVDTIMDGNSDNLQPDKINEGNIKIFPSEITGLVGRKFVFKIDITSFNISNNYKSFTIKKLTDDPDILSKLEANLDIEHVDTPDSSLMNSADFRLKDVVLKECESSSAENATPSLLDSSGKMYLDNENISNNNAHIGLKRNLAELYEDDECVLQSATRPPKHSIQGPKDVPAPKLLIPKKEK